MNVAPAQDRPRLGRRAFDGLRRVIHARSGIALNDSKLALVESRLALVQLPLALQEPLDLALALAELALALVHAYNRRRQPVPALVQLRRHPRQLGRALFERSLTVVERLRAALGGANIARAMRQLGLGCSDLCRAAAELLFQRALTLVARIDFALPLVELPLTRRDRCELRIDERALLLEPAAQTLEIIGPRLELGCAPVELRRQRRVETLAVGDVRESALQLERAFFDFAHGVLALLERALGRRKPLTALVELRGKRVRRELAIRERALALERPRLPRLEVVDTALALLDLDLGGAKLLFPRVEPRLPASQVLRTRGKLLGQRVEPLCPLVELRGAATDCLVEALFAVGERRPGFPDLVLTFRHTVIFAGRADAPIPRLCTTQVSGPKSVCLPP